MRHGRLDAAGGDFGGDDDDSGQGRGVKEWRRQQGGPRRARMPQEHCRCRGGRFPLFRSVSTQGARCNPCLQTGGRVCESGLRIVRIPSLITPKCRSCSEICSGRALTSSGSPQVLLAPSLTWQRYSHALTMRILAMHHEPSLSLSHSLCLSLSLSTTINKPMKEQTQMAALACAMCRLHSPEGLVMILILAMRPHLRCRRRNRKHMRIHRGRKDRVDRGDPQGRATQGERRQGRRRDGVHGPALR